MLWVLGIVGGLVVVGAALVFGLAALANRKAARMLAARGAPVGTWTVYYDVQKLQIGLIATFGEAELLRYLVFRVHDLFDYNQGLPAEQQRIAEALRAAARGAPSEPWQLLFPPPAGACFHADDAPDGKLFKFFDGTLYDNGIDQPRFLGGDSIAKQRGLVGEVVAVAAHLSRDPGRSHQVARVVEMLVSGELSQGPAPSGAAFWRLPSEALRMAG